MAETFTLASFLTDVGSILTQVMSWMTSVATAIAANPILLTFVAVPLIFLGVNMFRRLLSVQ